MDAQYHRISPSELSQYRRCRQLHHFTDTLRLQSIAPIRQLDTGIAVHKAQEVYYDPKYWMIPRHLRAVEAVSAFQLSMREQLTKLQKLGYELSDEDYASWQHDYDTCTKMLQHYYEYAQRTDDFTPLAVEYKINTPLMEPCIDFDQEDPPPHWTPALCPCHGWPIHLTSKIDLVKQMPDGSIRLVDWKSAEKFYENSASLSLDQQTGTYLLGYQKQEQVLPAGVDYVELRKAYPQPPKQIKGSKAEPIKLSMDKTMQSTAELYEAEVKRFGLDRNKYAEFIETLRHSRGDEYWFRSTSVERSQRELIILQENIVKQTLEMLSNPAVYPNPTALNCNGCAFIGPCQAVQDGSDYEVMLREDYEPKKSNRDEPEPIAAEEEELPF